MSPALAGGFFTTELPGKPLEPSTNLCDATWRGQVWCFCQEGASSSAHLGELLKQGDLSRIFSQLRFPLHKRDPGKGGVKHLVQRQKWWQISHLGANQVELETWRTNGVKERKQKIKGGGRNGGRGRQEGREEWGREEKEESKMLLLLPLHPVKGKGGKKRYIYLNAEFQKLARRDRKPSSVINGKKWTKTIEWERLEISSRRWDNNGKLHAKMGSIKDRNCMDLTEAEDNKKRWKNAQKNYIKKIFMTQ